LATISKKMTSKLIIVLTFISTSIFAQIDCEKYDDNYIPIDLEDALNYLDCKWSKSSKRSFKKKTEDVAVIELHFGTGVGIRNSWGLWKGDSRIAKYFQKLGINHPDDMSGIILTSYHRHLNHLDLRLEEQIDYYISYWEKSEISEVNKMKKKFQEFIVNDTVDFIYPYFISNEQENNYLNDLCVAKGVVLAKDSTHLQLQIRLIKACDKDGILISRGDIYIQDGDNWILEEKDRLDTMKIGKIRWTNYNDWMTIE